MDGAVAASAGFGGVPVYRVFVNMSGNNATYVQCDTKGGSSLVALGITIGLISSVLINLGQNLQSIGGKEPGADENPCSSRTWATGMTIFAIGAIGNMVAMAFASATILVPLESSQFVTNICFSMLVNKVEITSRQWFGTALSVAGTVLICVFGPNDQRCFTLRDFRMFWANPTWIAWVLCTFSLSAVGWWFYHKLLAPTYSPKVVHHDPRAHVTTVEIERPQWVVAALPALFAVSSALIGGAQMIVHTKALAEIFDMWFAGQFNALRGELFNEWIFWVELVLVATCGFFWLRQMNASIVLYDPLFIIPLLQASYITFGATASGLFYQEFSTLSAGPAGPIGTWVLFVGGILMIGAGILLLAPPSSFDGCDCIASLNLRRRASSMRPRMLSHSVEGPGGSKQPAAEEPRPTGGDLQIAKL